MEIQDYVEKFRFDEAGAEFDCAEFYDDLRRELLEGIEACEVKDERTGWIAYHSYCELVSGLKEKFEAIARLKQGKKFSKRAWKYFYAAYVVPIRTELFPLKQEKLSERHEKIRLNKVKVAEKVKESVPEINREFLLDAGFKGFKTIGELMTDNCSPDDIGVVVILREKDEPPVFLEFGTGGLVNGNILNVSVEVLKRGWFDGAKALAIFNVGSLNSRKASIWTYLDLLFRFGAGEDVKKRQNGQILWQLADVKDLVVCWKTIEGCEPSKLGNELVRKFKRKHEHYPFANRNYFRIDSKNDLDHETDDKSS